MKQYLTEIEQRHAEKIDRIRVIIGVVFAISTIAIIVGVCRNWIDNGCGIPQLLCAIGFYSACMTGIWLAIDLQLKENK